MKTLTAIIAILLILPATARAVTKCDIDGGTTNTPAYEDCERSKRVHAGDVWRVVVKTHDQPVQVWAGGGAIQTRVAYADRQGSETSQPRRIHIRLRADNAIIRIRARRTRWYTVETHRFL